jgi:hypothetical protein
MGLIITLFFLAGLQVRAWVSATEGTFRKVLLHIGGFTKGGGVIAEL